MEWLWGLVVRMVIAVPLAGLTMWVINGLLEWDWHMAWVIVVWVMWVVVLYGFTEGFDVFFGNG
jgi:hypothetical protein